MWIVGLQEETWRLYVQMGRWREDPGVEKKMLQDVFRGRARTGDICMERPSRCGVDGAQIV